MSAIYRLALPDGSVRLASGEVDDGPTRLLPADVSLDDLLGGADAAPGASLAAALDAVTDEEVPAGSRMLAPIDGQEVWASGVTFERSREARNEEAGPVDIYDRVYEAHRPELFCKATPARVRGPGEPVGIRRDSGWDVPEPELGLVADAAGRLVAVTVGNDMSSRSIEGENPLYLPQAKIYTGSCALGPALVPLADAEPLSDLVVELEITRDGDRALHRLACPSLRCDAGPRSCSSGCSRRSTSRWASCCSPAPRSCRRRSSRSAQATSSTSRWPASAR